MQIYLTPDKAEEFVSNLSELLANPEANEHFQIISSDSGWE